MINRLCVLIAVVFAVLPVNSFADEIHIDELPAEISYPVGIKFEGTEIGDDYTKYDLYGISLASEADYNAFYKYLEKQCLNHVKEIDVSSYNIPSTQIFDIYCRFATYHPELLIRTKLQWTKTFLTGKTKAIMPEYLFDNVELDNEARALMQEKVNEYVNVAVPYSDTVTKLLFIHDEIVKNCKYDTEYSENSYHAYGIFKNNTAVCQGYSQAFYMISSALGIETDFCISEDINHVWNYIKIDGLWYHMDLTWDDPIVKNSNGEIVETTTAYHDNFLVSDAVMIKSHSPNTSWKTYLDALPKCENTNFEHDYIFNTPIPFSILEVDGRTGFYKSIDSKSILFSSKDIKSGKLLFSQSIDNSSFCTVYYYCLGEIEKKCIVYTGVFDQAGLRRITESDKGNLQLKGLYKHNFSKPSDGEYIQLFFWDTEKLQPYTDKITINKLLP